MADTNPILNAHAIWYILWRPELLCFAMKGYSLIIFWQTSHGDGRRVERPVALLTSDTERLGTDKPRLAALSIAGRFNMAKQKANVTIMVSCRKLCYLDGCSLLVSTRSGRFSVCLVDKLSDLSLRLLQQQMHVDAELLDYCIS
jgi:hypothetical protein